MSMGLPLPAASFSQISLDLAIHNQLIADYEPIDKQGMWLEPTPGTSAAALEVAITPTLQAGDWIVTSLKDNKVLIEPRVTRPIQVEPPGCVFHVTSSENRVRIRKG